MLPAFRPLTDDQRRANLTETETRVAPTMIFDDDGLSTGAFYPRWYGGFLCPAPADKERS